MSSWASYAVCPCGWKRQAPFGRVSHVVFDGSFITCCPKCGGDRDEMTVKIMRWMPPEIHLFRPSTWDNQGHWAEKNSESQPHDH